jgi:hypothetical protein
MWTKPWYIPCAGVRLKFDHLCLVERGDRPALWLQRVSKNSRRKVHREHIVDFDDDSAFGKIRKPHFEIGVGRDGSGGLVDVTDAHIFTFLLMIKSGGWIHAPAILSNSLFDDPQSDVFCQEFISATPVALSNTTLSITDAKWIRRHIEITRKFVEEPRFQNAMQALTSFHCIPYASFALIAAWTGLEALFQTEQEISFRLSLYISNFLRRRPEREEEFKKLRASYNTRSKIAHGLGTKAKAVAESAFYTRDILRECLQRSLETGNLPNINRLAFCS